MDSVEYSGLRQYLLSQKPRKDRVHRELWEANGATYSAYRKYLRHVREFGFPKEKESVASSMVTVSRQGSLPSNCNLKKTISGFTGVNSIIDGCQSAITAMSYGYLSTSMIAFGTVKGGVWVLRLHPSGHRLNKLLEHDEEVRDVDWSRDNALLLSCSFNGCVCLTSVERTHVCRKWIANTRTTCCKFHPLNQNMVIVGGGGSLYVFNCSTGSQVQRMTKIPSPMAYITEMICTGSHVFLGDSMGVLRLFKMKFTNNMLQLQALGNSFTHPYRTNAAITGIDVRAYSKTCNGQAVVVSYEDSTLSVYKIGISAHPKVELFSKLAMTPVHRRVRAVWWTPTDIDQPDHIAIGGQHANVHVYNLNSCGELILLSTLSAHEAPVTTVCWSYDGNDFVSGDESGTIIVWKYKSKGKVVHHSFS